MTLLRFLKANAMGVSGLTSTVLVIIFAFTHFTPAQTAVMVGGPPALGNFLLNMVLKNGSSKAAANGPGLPPS